MNVCMFTNTYLPHVGGVANSIHTFAADLKRSGNRVLIIAPVYPGSDSYDKDKRDTDVLRVPAIEEVNGSDFSISLDSSAAVCTDRQAAGKGFAFFTDERGAMDCGKMAYKK